MTRIISILAAALLISTISYAGGKQDPAGAAAAGAGAPTGLHLKIVQNGLKLYWTVSPGDPGPVTGYEIVRADRFSGPYDPVATVRKGTSEYIDATASQEIIYFYKVRAVTADGHSPFSNTVSGERH